MKDKINLEASLSTFSDHWSPRTIAKFNDNDVLLVKIAGPFHWHKHDETDDFFLVLEGACDMELRGKKVSLGVGDLYIVPKGVEHRPVGRPEASVLLLEVKGTPNTGDAETAAPRRVLLR